YFYPNLTVKKQKFLQSLKKTYKLQYDAVQPIPYIKDRLYRVDKVFIEGGIEIYITEDDKWVGIESYKDIFTDLRIKSTRRIIKAEAGYGKSTSTLQLAYDWCKGVKDSPLKDVDILILLRLRQLGGITSIYEAIKRLLVPDDKQIKSTDIKDIIESCTSVEILLDGYDEYPDQDTETGSDVERIITGEIFPEINVSITTRYNPKEIDKDITKHIKFTGFDDEAREKYIRKAVTDNKWEVRKIREALQANPILDDLCVVPLLFVMFAHMSHEEKEFLDCKSVTDFFRNMMKCFHSHMRNKRRNNNTEPYNSQFEIEHTELDEVAYEGLANENQQLSWEKKMLCDRLGRGLYNHYLALGLLVEEMVVVMTETNRQEEHTIIEVHFYHKLFCEWFAAFRLVKIVAATEDAAKVKEVLDKFDPNDLQYLFRFSCGIDSKVSSKIVTYLKRRQDCRNFAILCIMEQTGELDEDIKGTITEVCSEEIKLQTSDSKLLQRSTIQVLDLASRTEIAVSCLSLDTCFTSADQSEITLESGLRVPNLSSLEQMEIKEQKGKIFTAEEILGAIRYGIECHNLTKITFIDCVLPLSFNSESLIPAMKTHKLTVSWKPLDCEFHLDLSSGKWIDFLPASFDDQLSLQQMCSKPIVLQSKEVNQHQPSLIMILKIASSHSMAVSCLNLDKCFAGADQSRIILESGLRVPKLSSLEQLEIKEKRGKIFTAKEILGAIRYGMKCNNLTKISFIDCVLPLSFDSKSLISTMKTQTLTVLWKPLDCEFHLDLSSGKWRGFLPDSTLAAGRMGTIISFFKGVYKDEEQCRIPTKRMLP
ncbi:uncharacterized protein, partial [Apostichopus japonicus]|uniref:uncharacterized protein n=1 Tax=Stichopus japonicus TaxID=307972 RepID=UPI003AB5AD7F